jgi:hypothetical protein
MSVSAKVRWLAGQCARSTPYQRRLPRAQLIDDQLGSSFATSAGYDPPSLAADVFESTARVWGRHGL